MSTRDSWMKTQGGNTHYWFVPIGHTGWNLFEVRKIGEDWRIRDGKMKRGRDDREGNE